MMSAGTLLGGVDFDGDVYFMPTFGPWVRIISLPQTFDHHGILCHTVDRGFAIADFAASTMRRLLVTRCSKHCPILQRFAPGFQFNWPASRPPNTACPSAPTLRRPSATSARDNFP